MIVVANKNGNAPYGCSHGDIVITNDGNYRIISDIVAKYLYGKRGVKYNPLSGYWSQKITENEIKITPFDRCFYRI